MLKSKIEVNWEADLLPNKRILTSERYPYATVKTKGTLGFPVIEVEGKSIARIIS